MSSNGYVYVLLNLSIQGLVKIGMTTRDPENRVAELSNATGVVTPFVLVYKEYFNDCHFAEKQLHAFLEQKNYRVSNNREFFSIPVHDAIKLIQNLKSQENSNVDEENELINSKSNEISDIAKSVLEEATSYYYGSNGKLEDYEEAFKLFKQSARMGAIEAFEYLGKMYLYGDGVKQDIKIALDYFKQGSKAGWIDCFGNMARVYSTYEEHKHKDNADKCWESYFHNIDKSYLKEFFMEEYIYCYLTNGWQVIHKDIISNFKNEIILNCNKYILKYKNNSQFPFASEKFEMILGFIERININVLIEKPSYKYGHGKVISLFNIDGQPMLDIKISEGGFNVGDKILLIKTIDFENIKLQSEILQIEVNQKSVATANIDSGGNARLLIKGIFNDFSYLKNGGVIASL